MRKELLYMGSVCPATSQGRKCVRVCACTRGRDVEDHVGAVRVLVTFYMSVCVCERERERERFLNKA